jgi:AraC-like DNA-binding protein
MHPFRPREGYAVYHGAVADSPLHSHAAFQIAIAVRGELLMGDSAGTHHRAVALVVSPLTPHRMDALGDLLTYFVDPHCAFADRLRECYGTGIAAAPELCDLREEDIVGQRGGEPSLDLDSRLVKAVELLRSGDAPMSVLAAAVGLSAQRLRALARQQLGMPLTRWRVWARLRRAVEALQAGMSLADAAAMAGFSDQAHLTRQMREMMGVTPAVALPSVRGHLLCAT